MKIKEIEAMLEIARAYQEILDGYPVEAKNIHSSDGFRLNKITLENGKFMALMANDNEVWAEKWDNKYFNEPCFDNDEITFSGV